MSEKGTVFPKRNSDVKIFSRNTDTRSLLSWKWSVLEVHVYRFREDWIGFKDHTRAVFFSKIESSPEELFSVAFAPEGFLKINTPDFAHISAKFSDTCRTYDFTVCDPYKKYASASKIITIYILEVSIFQSINSKPCSSSTSKYNVTDLFLSGIVI